MMLRRSAGSSEATLALASYCEPAFRVMHECTFVLYINMNSFCIVVHYVV